MLSSLLMLGAIPGKGPLTAWLLMQLAKKAKPLVEKFFEDPTGSVGRLGDVLLWQGTSGRQVIGTLEALTESNERINEVVGHIETAQIGLASTIGTLTSFSMATLGVTSLAAGFMICRMNALHARLGKIGNQISDIQADLQAMKKTHLDDSLDFLARFEHAHSEPDRRKALDESTHATNLYGNLVQRETQGQRRALALNECGRYYLLSLTAQARCLMLDNQLELAEREIAAEKPTLTALAQTTFAEVMGKSPEAYLDPKLQADNVTLDLVTEVYQQAHQLGAVTGAEFKDAGQAFEHFRPKIYAAGGWFFRPSRKARAKLLTKLKYLMACLEDVSRIEALRLRIAEAIKGNFSLQDLEQSVAASKKQVNVSEAGTTNGPVYAFAFA